VPERVLKRGAPVGEIAPVQVPEWAKRTVHLGALEGADFAIPVDDGLVRVIGLVPGEIITTSLVESATVSDGFAVADASRDLAKVAVLERHLETGRIGLGFVRGFGLERGAIGSTVAHDAHNVIVAGVDDDAMTRAALRLRDLGGGLVVADGEGVLAELPLPVAGLLSDRPLAEVLAGTSAVTDAARRLGVTLPHPFQMLAFLALSVIPALKLTDRGLVDVTRFRVVPVSASPRPPASAGRLGRRADGRRAGDDGDPVAHGASPARSRAGP
jgi:adenine deaminase